MDILVKRDLFAIRLNKLKKFVGDAKTVPIHGNFLIKAKEKSVEITCGDGNTFVTDVYNMVNVNAVGETTVNAEALSKLLDSLTSREEIAIRVIDNKLEVKSGKSKFTLNTIPASQYPTLPNSFDNKLGDVNVKELQAGFLCSKVCVAKDMVNPYLTGFKVDGDIFTSDSLKICIYEENFGPLNLLLSGRCVDALMLINGSNTAQVYRNGNSVLIEADGFQVISNVLDKIEKFPNSKIFTGMTFDFTLTFDRSTLLPILNRAMIFTVADLSNAVVVSFKKGQLEISSYNAKDGAGSQEIIECGYDGNDISFLVDGKDFIDELTGLPTDSFELHFDGEKSEEEYKGLVKIKQGKVYYMLSILDVTDKGDA